MANFRMLLVLILLGATCFVARARSCVNYEPEIVSLVGTLSRRTVVNVSEQKEVIWILRLARPVCVTAVEGDDINVKRARVTDVQLVLEPEMFKMYRGLVGKKVRATGTLFGQHTAHHFTPVLLDVAEMEPSR